MDFDFEPEFPLPNRKDLEVIKSYLDVETEFMAVKDFFKDTRNILFRRHAVSIIAKVTKNNDLDTFVPYIAMNYFDRFLSRYDIKNVKDGTDIEKVRLIAISCLTISTKTRSTSFSIDQLLSDLNMNMNVRINHHMLMEMEFLILQELNWKMRSVTAFCFLNYYYGYFKRFGGFKRLCINKIIVQAQGDHTFVDFTPSHIAISAFMAATKIAYRSKYEEFAEDIIVMSRISYPGKVKKCVEKMVDLCIGMKMEASQLQGVNGTETCDDEPQPQRRKVISEIEQIEEVEESKKQMNFELKWPIDVPSLEVDMATDARPQKVDTASDARSRECTAVTLRIPRTGKYLNLGCTTCNIL